MLRAVQTSPAYQPALERSAPRRSPASCQTKLLGRFLLENIPYEATSEQLAHLFYPDLRVRMLTSDEGFLWSMLPQSEVRRLVRMIESAAGHRLSDLEEPGGLAAGMSC